MPKWYIWGQPALGPHIIIITIIIIIKDKMGGWGANKEWNVERRFICQKT